MKERRKLITDETIIEVDEEVLKIKAQYFYWKMLVKYINEQFDSPVVELNI